MKVKYEIESIGVSGFIEIDTVLKKVKGKYKRVLPIKKIKQKIRERHGDYPIKIIK